MTQPNPDIPLQAFPFEMHGLMHENPVIAESEQVQEMRITPPDFAAEVTQPGNPTLEAEPQSRGRLDRVKDWIVERKTRLVIGAAALSTAVTLTFNPLNELKDDVIEAAPWVVGGIAASEAAFCLGGVMMIASIGDKIGNPLSIKKRIPEIAQRANDSKIFKTGFWMNAVGAVGDFVVLSAGVMRHMPVESYPLLGLTLLDLGATIAARKLILSGIENNVSKANVSEVGGEV